MKGLLLLGGLALGACGIRGAPRPPLQLPDAAEASPAPERTPPTPTVVETRDAGAVSPVLGDPLDPSPASMSPANLPEEEATP